MSQAIQLFRLQQVDSQLDKVRARLKEIETILKDDKEIQMAQRTAEAAETAHQNTEKLLRKAEQNTRDHRQKIKQTEDRLYSGKVRNPKELEDLQNESAALKRYLDTLEERQIEAMMENDDAKETYDEAKATLAAVQGEKATEHALLRGERDELLNDLKRLDVERNAATNNIDPDDIRKYDKLRTKLRGIAVAKVVQGSCTACGSALTSSLLKEVRSTEELTTCAMCKRILYAG